MRSPRTLLPAAALLLPLGLLTACGEDAATGGGSGEGVTLTLAHSYTEEQPQHACGAAVIEEQVESSDTGLTVDVFPGSQLGGDADRIASVQSGDIDIDIQGASALASLHEPIGVVDAAYAFESSEHLVSFFQGEQSEQVKQAFLDASDVRILGAWSVGARHFTANRAIRQPQDLDGLRMRFPGSPQYLLNAEALGAQATEVAYEELYLALQQGVADGQENPIVNIAASNLAEVQDYLSLSGHQQNSNLIVVGPVWNELDGEQQEALTAAVEAAVEQVPGCVAKAEEEQLATWRDGDGMEVVDDVDVEAFSARTEEWFRANLEGESLTVYEAIKNSAP